MMQREKIQIRPAVREDAVAMMQLIKELAAFERAPEQVTVSLDHFIESGFGPNPVWWAWVAEVTVKESNIKQVIGFALYYVRYSTWKGQRMYLEDIIVTEKWRNRKAGSLLLEQLIEVARAKKYSGIMWQVLNWNTDAIRFYEKYGARFDDSWINVSLDLEPELK